jgi:4-aminobutyrate aminotransferase-like enzyme
MGVRRSGPIDTRGRPPQVIQDDGLLENAAARGAQFEAGLGALQALPGSPIGEVRVGFGRNAALHYRSSTSYQIH